MKKNLFSRLNHARLNWRHRRQFDSKVRRLKSFGDFAEGVYVEVDQGRFILDPADIAVSKALLNEGAYGLREIELAKKFIGPGSTCILLGAHIGSICIPLSRFCKKLFAFEPNPKSFSLLSMNVLINQANNIIHYNLACSDRDEDIRFIVHDANSGSSRRKPHNKFTPVAFEEGKEIVVKAKSLDSTGSQIDGLIDLIFMDIEGSEYFALKGGSNLLPRVQTLIMEFSPDYIKNVANVSIKEFWSILEPYFDLVYSPESGEVVSCADKILMYLTKLADSNMSFDNLVFSKKTIFDAAMKN